MPVDDITAGIDQGIDQQTEQPAAAAGPAPTTDEMEAVAQWLYAGLTTAVAASGLAILAISEDEVPVAPDNVTPRLPAIVFNVRSSRDELGVAATRLWTWTTYSIRVIDQSDRYGTMSALVTAIYNTINKQTGNTPTGGFWIGGCYRTSPLRYFQRDTGSGNRYNYQGGLYRIMHYPLPDS